MSGRRHECLSPDTLFLSVSMACRKRPHSCLASLWHASTSPASFLQCHCSGGGALLASTLFYRVLYLLARSRYQLPCSHKPPNSHHSSSCYDVYTRVGLQILPLSKYPAAEMGGWQSVFLMLLLLLIFLLTASLQYHAVHSFIAYNSMAF